MRQETEGLDGTGGTGRPVGASEDLGDSTAMGRSPMGGARTSDRRTFPLRDGEDFVCPTCGCEIRVRHAGTAADDSSTTFTCVCGAAMRPEHPRAA